MATRPIAVSGSNPARLDSGASSRRRKEKLYKVLLVGDSGVGKTSIINRFTENSFAHNMSKTLAADVRSASVTVDGETVQLQIWDTAGHSDYRSLSSSYYRGAHGVLVVYDVSKFASFQNLQVWLEEIDMHASANVCCMLVGNKSEGTEKGARVDIKMAEEFARNIGSYGARSLARSFRPMTFSAKQDFICVSADDSNLGEINENGFDANFPHMQVSAKSSHSIGEVFENLVRLMIENNALENTSTNMYESDAYIPTSQRPSFKLDERYKDDKGGDRAMGLPRDGSSSASCCN